MSLETESLFPCDKCGACCRHVDRAHETQFLDRGDGVCKNYNETNMLCTIYDERPDICRVDKQYSLHYHKQYTWHEFIEINRIACEIILSSE
ncbi:YkgJ family cysteine cluster protein [Providencia vermicola]|uniref:YkgJ family cysteine cluster protein n=2 Tax=Providencia TaxID=586 RepID=A0ABD5L6X1_PROST|nr:MULTISPECIES: YkgJ family cysteine cluster protein [Providencia]ELR5043832.1 YkgJ family cysteine cluster protein [Providencia rettgeri]ELR5291330.1 YkgJ family cysteine cluster protein [Providencia stuartii]ELX8377655.1 YkgJ family cysteine cluster protein [Providencia stuartii]EMD5257196.1 YkgJ family cysteine cluster protein [Providencia stuartii]MCR4180418.1 YkgJ family cysteine cluster protein [Providencia vermicola]